MKKRLLITSIVMMLVVAVALSTATYAWFTSNDQVTANTVSLTAATSTESALGIAWQSPAGNTVGTAAWNANYQTYIAPYTMAAEIQPAAPTFLDGQTTLPEFKTELINAQGNFKGTGSVTAIYRMSNYADNAAAVAASATFSETVHIANLAQAGAKNVYMTAVITGQLVAVNSEGESATPTTHNYYDANKVLLETQPSAGDTVNAGYKELKDDGIGLIRIAVYENNNNTYIFKGCLSKNGDNSTKDTAVGAITNGGSAVALVSTTGYASTTELNLGSFAAQSEKLYVIYIWMDGQALDEAQSGKKAEITLNFTTSGAAAELNQN